MSDAPRAGGVMPGSGVPITARGRSIAYVPPPWHMRGRTIALWYRLADPDEARRHVPAVVQMEADPVVRARFWDLEHDGVPSGEEGTRPWRPFREAVVAFPVTHGGVAGDFPTYMYADDAAYIVFGREVMGWPVRDGRIRVDAEPDGGPTAGLGLGGRLERDGRTIMAARIELTGERVEVDDSQPPRWLAAKVISDVSHPRAAVSQLVATGPERIRRGAVWKADAILTFDEGPGDELHHLKPREIVEAQYWSDVELTIGWGEVLSELGEGVWTDG